MRLDWRTPLAVVTALVLGLALLPGPADARPQDGDLAGSGHAMPTRSQPHHFYGAKHLGGITAYCIDLNSGPPREASGWTEYTNYTLFRQTGWGGPRGEHGNGTRKTLVAELAELSWILHATGPSPSPDVGAAVEHTVRLRTLDGVEQERKEAERWAAVVAKHPGSHVEFEQLQREAADLAGPYTLDVTWNRRPTATNATGELSIRVLSASGVPVPNRPVVMTSTGDLEITSYAKNTGPDGSTRAWVQLPVPEASTVTGAVGVEVQDLPGPRPRLFVPVEKTIQRMIAAPNPITLAWQEQIVLEPDLWHPVVTTRTRDQVATAGSPAVDIVTVTSGRPGAEFSGTSTLFGPFASLEELAAASPAEATAVGTATFEGTYDDDGAAEVHTTELQFPEAGYYMWREQLTEAELVVLPPEPAWPQLPETSVVVSPTVTSELVMGGEVSPGVQVTDTLHLQGVPESRAVPESDEPLQVLASGRLLGPLPPTGSGEAQSCEAVDWQGAPVLARYDEVEFITSILGGLLSATLPEPGCYTATAHVEVRHLGQLVTEFHHGPGVPSQSVLVPALPEVPPPPTPTPSPSPSPTPTPTPTPSPTPPPAPASPPPAEPPAPPTATPPQGSTPPEPATPRINSGSPIREVHWHLVHLGLLVSCTATLAGVGLRRRRS